MSKIKREKNDGTDPKKDDGNDKTIMATDRVCRMRVTNQLSQANSNVALTHSSGDTNTVINVATLNSNDSSPEKQISFETGFWADFDYWNVSFNIGGQVYNTPWNDRCNISYEDAGGLIDCQIQEDSHYGGDHNLHVGMPKSSSCNFNVSKN